MKRIHKLLALVLSVIFVISIMSVATFTASAYSLLSENEFIAKINALKSQYPEKSSPDYTYYEGGTARAWTCYGFANKLAYYCFGSSIYTSGGGWSKGYDSSSFNAGDIVRVDGDSHTIFITYVSGSAIKYAEGNHTYANYGYYSAVRWDVQTTLSALQSRFTYKYHLSGNTLSGTGSGSSLTVIDYSAKFELMCNSKPEHATPYGSSDTTKTYKKGDIITVVGYTYNDYGNLWYKTAAGGYIYYEYLKLDTMVKYLPPSNYVEATVKVKGISKWIKSSSSVSGEYLKEYKKDDTIQITHYLYNSAGNLWYETSEGDGHYVFYSYLEVQSASDWMPSSYVEGTVEIENDNTPVRDIIQGEGSTVVERLNKGDTKQVIGYAYNRYGNLWYVLGEDRVVFYDCCKNKGDSELLSNYIGQEMIVSKETKLYAGNYWGTVTDTTVSAGAKVNVVAYVINKYGNKYYEIEGEKYIPEGYLIPYNYTVSFDSNGGNGTMADLKVVYEEVFTLPECSFNKQGYEFKGWNAQRKCDGKWYVQNKGWNSDADIIANNYTKNVYSDKWEGYLNNSWANNIVEANEFTLYALWEPVSHTHNYESFTTPPTCTTQGYTTHTCSRCGDCYVDTCVNALGHTGGTATCCKKAVCTRCGKEYGEFDPTNHAGGTEVKNAKAATEEAAGYTGDTYCKGCGKKLSTGKSIAAKVVTYKITYKLDGGKDPKNPTTYTYATSTIKLKNPTKKGYDFKGWYNGTKKVTEIKKGSKGNVTLTAKWSKITYKITYKLAGGKNAKNPTSYTVTTSTVKLQNPTRKGYTFKGWYNGSKKVTEIKKGSTGDVTLTAKWETITYKITYKLAGGKAVKNPTSYKVTTSTVTLKNPTKKGYTFKGWYNGKKKVTTIKKGSTGNITLTAKWAKKK